SAVVVVDLPSYPTRRSSDLVLRDGEVGAERELLVDDDDALLLAVPDRAELARLAGEEDLAVVAAVRVDAGQDVHQRRLAGAVLRSEEHTTELQSRENLECRL